MAKKDQRRAELDALAVELAGPAAAAAGRTHAAGENSAPEQPDRDDATDFEKILRDIEEKFAITAQDIEEIVASHPLAALGAAFLLGLVIGRVTRRG